MSNISNNGGLFNGLNFLGNFTELNPFARYFQKNREDEIETQHQRNDNSQGTSVEDMLAKYQYTLDGDTQKVNIVFNPDFQFKQQRVMTYRSMSSYPAISMAIDAICDDAILPDSDGNIAFLEFKKELPEHIQDTVNKYWKYLIDDVFNFNNVGWDMFRKWLIDGELFVELILNDAGDSIIGVKSLPPFTMYPIFQNNDVVCYVQSTKNYNLNGSQNMMMMSDDKTNRDVIFDADQIVYTNYSDMAGASKIDVFGFLENSIRAFNQLKNLEDATVVNKIVRAPTRRIWNIDVGMMNKTKGDAYVRSMIQRIKKNIQYDPSSGNMNANENFLAMTEDFYFPKNAEGRGTTVENIDGTSTFDDMSSVNYFLKRLYESMKIPTSRWMALVEGATPSVFSGGKSNEITREEISFGKFITRLQNKFKYILLDALIVQLRLSDIDERYCDHSLYNIRFNKSNLFEMYKELENLEARMAILSTADGFAYKKDENENGYFAREYVLKDLFKMTDEEYNKNLFLLNREKNNVVSSTNEGDGQDTSMDDQASDIMGDSGDTGMDSGMDTGMDTTPEPDMGAEITPEEPLTASYRIDTGNNTILNELKDLMGA